MLPKHVRYQTAPHPDNRAVPYKQQSNYIMLFSGVSSPCGGLTEISEFRNFHVTAQHGCCGTTSTLPAAGLRLCLIYLRLIALWVRHGAAHVYHLSKHVHPFHAWSVFLNSGRCIWLETPLQLRRLELHLCVDFP